MSDKRMQVVMNKWVKCPKLDEKFVESVAKQAEKYGSKKEILE